MQSITLVLSALLALTAALPMDVEMKLITNIAPKCAKENNVSQEDVMAFSRGNLPNKKNNKCFLKCCFQKLEIMDAKGGVTADKFFKKAKIPAKDAQRYKTCAGPSYIKSDPCETAFAIATCIGPKL